MLAAEKKEENNCPICRDPVTRENSVSLHKPGENFDHRLHVDCLHPFLAKITPSKCPVCQQLVDEEVINNYKTPAAILVASMRKNDMILTGNQIVTYANMKSFCMKSFLELLVAKITKENADVDKISSVINELNLKFENVDDPVCVSSINVLKHVNDLFPLKDIIDNALFYWRLEFARIIKFGLNLKWNREQRNSFFEAFSASFESRKFITADIWELACSKGCAVLLNILLPHTIPSCFNERMQGVDIALRNCNIDLLKKFFAVNDQILKESIRSEILKPDFYCQNVELVDFLIKLGFEPKDMFNVNSIFQNNRAVIVDLLKRGLWPMEYFVNLNGSKFRNLKTILRKHNSIAFLSNAFDLCMTLFGVILYPKATESLYELYQSNRYDFSKFEELADFTSDAEVYRQVKRALEALIQDSWSSLTELEERIRKLNLGDEVSFLSNIYNYAVCYSIPFLSRTDLELAEQKYQGLLQALGGLDIPITIYAISEINEFIKTGDILGLSGYLKENILSPVGFELAIIRSLEVGNAEITNLLINRSLGTDDSNSAVDDDAGKTDGDKDKDGSSESESATKVAPETTSDEVCDSLEN